MMQAPLSPPRSTSSGLQLLSATLSPLRPIHALNDSHTIDLDTSLDDEYFAANTNDASPESLFPPVIEMPASQTLPTSAPERDDFLEHKYDDEQYAAAAPLLNVVNTEAEEFDEESFDDDEEDVLQRSVLPTPHAHPRTPMHPLNTSHSQHQFHLVTPSHHGHTTSSASMPVLVDYQGKQIDATMRRNLLAPPMQNVHNDHQLKTNVFIQAAATSLSIAAPSSLLNSLASGHAGMGLQKLESQLQQLSKRSPNTLQEQQSPLSNSSSNNMWMHSPSTNFSSPSSATSFHDSPSTLSSTSVTSPAAAAIAQLGESTIELDLLHVEESAVEEVCDAIEEMGHVDEDDESEEAVMEEHEIAVNEHHDEFPDASSPVKQLRLEDFQTPIQAAPELPPRSAPPTNNSSSAPAVNLSMQSSFALNTSTAVNTSSVSTQARSGSSKKKKILKPSSLSLQPPSMTLPKIQPPTLEQIQALNRPSQNQTPAKQVIASKLKTIKKKLATRPTPPVSEIPPSARTNSAPSTAAASKLNLRELNPSAFDHEQKSKIVNKPKQISGPKALLARLTSHALSHAIELQEEQTKQSPNPWMTAEEIEEQEEREKQQLLIPSHRMHGHIEHTPAKKSREEAEEDEAAAKALQIRSVDMALPTSSIRSMVPSLWMQQIHSDKIHDNMQYFTVAYDY